MDHNSFAKIPCTFSPWTEVHDLMIIFQLPPLAQKIYGWLTRRAKPGTIQEFDKADFDEYCRDKRDKPFSLRWFVTCFKMLLKTRLVRLIRQYRGYGYKLIAYHPWQLDDWVIEDDRQKSKYKGTYQYEGTYHSSNSLKRKVKNSDSSDRQANINLENRLKTSDDRSKKVKKLTRNSDSAVTLDRENRVKEKGNTKAPNSSDRVIPKPILKKTAFAAPPSNDASLTEEKRRADGKEVTTPTAEITKQEETAATGKKETSATKITDPKETAVSTPLKGGDDINSRPTPLTSVKNDLKVILENVNKDNGDDKNNGRIDEKVNKKESRTKPPKVDVKINNKEWRSHLEEVDQLGIRGNKTIINALKTSSTERVKAAIALYRQRKIENGYIENPCGYFMHALQ